MTTATKRRQSADPLERYYSRPEFVRPLMTWLEMVRDRDVFSTLAGRNAALSALNTESLAIEPCAGHGALIVGALQVGLRSPNAPWRTVDIDLGAQGAIWRGDFTGDSALWRPRGDTAANLHERWPIDAEHVTLVITNPPFSHTIEIVKACWRQCPNAVVAILQRQTWYEPTQERAEFITQYPPDVICIGRCTFLGVDGQPIRDKTGNPGGGDRVSHAWFVWGPLRIGLAGGMTRIIPWRNFQ